MTFDQLYIPPSILRNLNKEGYISPTPIQEQALPLLLAGHDMLGCAQTGSGKTAAFAIPIIHALHQQKQSTRSIRALVLAPTRELAAQIRDSFITYGKDMNLKIAVVYGGVSKRNQIVTLKRGVDVLIATPGRLLDLMEDKFVTLESITHFVLDEADRMLDMGFSIDIERIITKLPKKRQTMLFSATLPSSIMHLANAILIDPKKVEITPEVKTLDVINQQIYLVNKNDKTALLNLLLSEAATKSALIFTRTKHGANKLLQALEASNVSADAIHGNKSQLARQKAMLDFKQKRIQVLIATDIASRGIDIHELSHVINYDLPEDPDTYIHRIGRTGRAGYLGTAISFCSKEETHLLKAIERHINSKITIIHDHPFKETFVSKAKSKPIDKKTPSKNSDSFTSSRKNETKTYSRSTDTPTPSRDKETRTYSRNTETPTPSRNKEVKTYSRNTESPTPSRDKEIKTYSRNTESPKPYIKKEIKTYSRSTESPTPSRDKETRTYSRNTESPTPYVKKEIKTYSRSTESPTPSRDKETRTYSRNTESPTPSRNKETRTYSRNTESSAPSKNKESRTYSRNTETSTPYIKKETKPYAKNTETPSPSRKKTVKSYSRNTETPSPSRKKETQAPFHKFAPSKKRNPKRNNKKI